MESNKTEVKKSYGGKALIPVAVFLGLYLGCGIVFTVLGADSPFGKMPRYVAVVAGILVALLCYRRDLKFSEKVDIYCKGAGASGVGLLGIIVLLAGAFASSTAAIGGKEAMVNMGIDLIPTQFLIPGIFLMCCIISTCIGTSMGTQVTMIPIKALVEQQKDYIISMRREFHTHPEVSGKELHTREVLIRELEAMGVPYEKLPGTGLIATIKGAKPGKHRVLRADIDALPVQEEENNLKQKKACISAIPGACHACGHDAHMAMLLGTMKVLLQLKEELCGEVYCCFEEGEETNCGIDTMMDALKKYTVDECFALHVYNALDAGKVNVVAGPRMAGTIGIGIYLHGKTGHGSRPDQAISTIIPAAHIVTQLNSAFMNQLNVEETVTLGFGMLTAGTATNIIPDEAYIGGTARFFNAEEGEKALKIIDKVTEATAATFNCTVTYQNRHNISPKAVINDPEVVARVQKQMEQFGAADKLADCDRWFASECYSAYLDRYPGALGMLGIRNKELGSGAAHHNGKFDMDESALPLGTLTELAFVFSNNG